MKYVLIFIVTFTVAFLLATAFFKVISGKPIVEPEIKPGQVWVYHAYDKNNPFEKDKHNDTLRVIGVSDDYVQYINIANGDTASCTKHWFLIGQEPIKE